MTYDSENDSLDIDRLYELFIDNIIYETHVTDKLDENQYNNLTKYLYRIYRNTIDIVNREKGLDKWDALFMKKLNLKYLKFL